MSSSGIPAGVAHAYIERAASGAAAALEEGYVECDTTIVGSELDGVAEKVDKHLADGVFIIFKHRRGEMIHRLYLNPPLLGIRLEWRYELVDEFQEIAAVDDDIHLP